MINSKTILIRFFHRTFQSVAPIILAIMLSVGTLPSSLNAQTTNIEPTHADDPNVWSNYDVQVLELEDRLEDWQPDEEENQAKAKAVLKSIYYHQQFFFRMKKAQQDCKQDDFDLYRATLIRFLDSDRTTLEPDSYFTHHIDKIKDIVLKITFRKPCTEAESVTTAKPPKTEVKKGETKKPKDQKTTVKKNPNCQKPQNRNLKYCKARAAAIERAKQRAKDRKAKQQAKGKTKKNNVTKQIIDVGTQVLINEGAKKVFKKNKQNNNNNNNNNNQNLFSDLRLKRDIKHLTTLSNNLKLYAFRYLWSETTYVGVMAQDLLKQDLMKKAVSKSPSGFYQVDYQSLGLKMISLQQWQESGVEAIKITRH